MGRTRFAFDVTTPHPGVTIDDECIVTKDTNGGWVTVKSSTPLSPGNMNWSFKILDQGEGSDGSGLMLGFMAAPLSSYSDWLSSFGRKYIYELGGWCLSRSGILYGSYARDRLPFGTGSVVEFSVDPAASTIELRISGGPYWPDTYSLVAAAPGVPAVELYPAVSLFYMDQRVAFV